MLGVIYSEIFFDIYQLRAIVHRGEEQNYTSGGVTNSLPYKIKYVESPEEPDDLLCMLIVTNGCCVGVSIETI